MRAAEDRIGHVLGGKYRVQQLLAAGGMGLVYAGRHEVTGRSVALKLLRPELATRPDLVQQVSREARLAVHAAHPNVVQVLDAGADEAGAPFLVLERLYGLPLEALLLGQPLSLGCTLEALVPVCNALAALHQAGIVHRDLKPSNIFLSREEGGRITPKLLDFGIAKALESSGSTLTGMALGTPVYMAPEQLLCSVASPASDVWSLAVVCVRCLTGRLPFADLARRGLLALGSAVRPSELDGVPEPLARVLATALRCEAAERPADAGEFRAQLLSALHELDPEQSWPDASSIGFSEHESELGRALSGSLGADAGTPGGSQAAMARPLDVLTRTLARAWHSAWRQRFRRHRGYALLIALLGSGLLALALRRAPMLAAPIGAEPAAAASVELTARKPIEPATPADGTQQSAAVAATDPLLSSGPALPGTGERTRHGPRRDPGRASPASPGSRLPSMAARPETGPEATPPVLGANRSPIIE
jgi:hypothetical protein